MWPVFKPSFDQKVKLIRLRISLVTVAWFKTETVNLVCFQLSRQTGEKLYNEKKDSASKQKGLARVWTLDSNCEATVSQGKAWAWYRGCHMLLICKAQNPPIIIIILELKYQCIHPGNESYKASYFSVNIRVDTWLSLSKSKSQFSCVSHLTVCQTPASLWWTAAVLPSAVSWSCSPTSTCSRCRFCFMSCRAEQ